VTPMAKNRLHRRDIVGKLLADRGDLLVVAGLGASAWDCTAIGDHPLTFPLWGGMGLAVSIGLGLARAQPDRRVLVVTGDGEMLMGMGSLATVTAAGAPNLAIALLDNERYGETGNQETHTASGVDLAGVAKACGFGTTLVCREEGEVQAAVRALRQGAGPVFVTFKISDESLPLVLPPREGAVLTHRFRAALLGADAAVK
jgi:thiamine pyrophosphate-dependent acetolactate synthase large subunit-like protein